MLPKSHKFHKNNDSEKRKQKHKKITPTSSTPERPKPTKNNINQQKLHKHHKNMCSLCCFMCLCLGCCARSGGERTASHCVCNCSDPLIRRKETRTFVKMKPHINAHTRAVFSDKKKRHMIITFREINSSNFLTLLRLSTDQVDNPGGV